MDDAALIELVVRSRACEVHGCKLEWLAECLDCAACLELARMVQKAALDSLGDNAICKALGAARG